MAKLCACGCGGTVSKRQKVTPACIGRWRNMRRLGRQRQYQAGAADLPDEEIEARYSAALMQIRARRIGALREDREARAVAFSSVRSE